MAKKTTRNVLTLDEVINQLQKIKANSPLGGGTCMYICVPGYEYQAIHEITLADTEASSPVNPCGVVLFVSDTLDTIVDDIGMEGALDDEDDDLDDGIAPIEGSDPCIEATLDEKNRVVLTVYPSGKRYFYGDNGRPTTPHGGCYFAADPAEYVKALQDEVDHNLGDWLVYVENNEIGLTYIGVKPSTNRG